MIYISYGPWAEIWPLLFTLYLYLLFWSWMIWCFRGWWWRTRGGRHINDCEVVCGAGYNEASLLHSPTPPFPHRKASMVEHNLNDHLMESLRSAPPSNSGVLKQPQRWKMEIWHYSHIAVCLFVVCFGWDDKELLWLFIGTASTINLLGRTHTNNVLSNQSVVSCYTI